MTKTYVYSGVIATCETPDCEATFPLLKKGGKQRRYCSDACRERWRGFNRHPRRKEPLVLECEFRYCGKVFEHWRLGQKPRFCSTACQVGERDAVRRDIKAECVEYLGGACICCGYRKCHAAMHFHHVDPSTKAKKISDFARGTKTAWDERREELDKCVLLCANCHAEEHALGLLKGMGA